MITKQLIMNPENADRLVSLLNYAIELLSGIQQPPMSTEEEFSKEDQIRENAHLKLASHEIEHIAKQIYTGLTGKIIRDKKK